MIGGPEERYGRLVIIERLPPRTKGAIPEVRCRCDCGEETIVLLHNLRAGRTRSCGCLRVETMKARGKARIT